MTISRPKLALHYAIVLCGALALYVASCAPGALWQDSGLIQYRVWNNDIEGFLGLAVSHPLFYILAIGAKYIPLGDFPYRVNLVSAIAGAFAVANMFLFVRLWLGRNLPALVAALTLAVSHTFWRHASVIETYTLWAALFLAELIMLLQYTRTRRASFLYWLGLLNGFSIAVHMLASIPLFCYVVFAVFLMFKKQIRIRDMAVMTVLWFIAAMPYEYLIVKNIIQTGDIAGTFASAVFGSRWREAVLNTSIPTGILKENILYILFNFPTPNMLLIFAGSFGLSAFSSNRHLRNILYALLVMFFLFAFRYTVPDRYAFFIPFYCVASIFAGIGTYILQKRINDKIFTISVLFFSLVPIAVYTVAPTLTRKMHVNIGTRSDIHYRDEYKYFMQPWKTGYRGAERFADEALGTAGENAVIYADTTTAGPLLLAQQVKGIRPDVKIVSGTVNSEGAPKFDRETIAQLVKELPVYVVSTKPGYCPEFVLDNYHLIYAGILWQVAKCEKP